MGQAARQDRDRDCDAGQAGQKREDSRGQEDKKTKGQTQKTHAKREKEENPLWQPARGERAQHAPSSWSAYYYPVIRRNTPYREYIMEHSSSSLRLIDVVLSYCHAISRTGQALSRSMGGHTACWVRRGWRNNRRAVGGKDML